MKILKNNKKKFLRKKKFILNNNPMKQLFQNETKQNKKLVNYQQTKKKNKIKT